VIVGARHATAAAMVHVAAERRRLAAVVGVAIAVREPARAGRRANPEEALRRPMVVGACHAAASAVVDVGARHGLAAVVDVAGLRTIAVREARAAEVAAETLVARSRRVVRVGARSRAGTAVGDARQQVDLAPAEGFAVTVAVAVVALVDRALAPFAQGIRVGQRAGVFAEAAVLDRGQRVRLARRVWVAVAVARAGRAAGGLADLVGARRVPYGLAEQVALPAV